MEQGDRGTKKKGSGGLAKLFPAGRGPPFFPSSARGRARCGPRPIRMGRHRVWPARRSGWLIVCGIAIAFVLYGFFAFFVIGDKGPPGWDYGSLPDVPGESTYSTYPFRESGAPQPEPQHVDEKPAKEQADVSAGQGRTFPEKQPQQEPAKP